MSFTSEAFFIAEEDTCIVKPYNSLLSIFFGFLSASTNSLNLSTFLLCIYNSLKLHVSSFGTLVFILNRDFIVLIVLFTSSLNLFFKYNFLYFIINSFNNNFN